MKKSRFSDSQIISILKQAENGSSVPELCREQVGFILHSTGRNKVYICLLADSQFSVEI